MKKEVDMCDCCEEDEACYKITKGADKGTLLCESCLDDWKEEVLEDMYEDYDSEEKT